MLALAMKERVMLRRSIVVMGTVAALGILFGSANASAAGHGARGGHPHAFNAKAIHRHVIRQNRRANRAAAYRRYWYWPYGGFGGEYLPSYYTPGNYDNFYDPIGAFSMLQRLDPVIPPPPPITCHHSVETRTVPSEAGGTVKITITRC
jgi:hypothetical protein